MNIPDHISESLETICWVKTLKSLMRIRDPEYFWPWIRDGINSELQHWKNGMEKLTFYWFRIQTNKIRCSNPPSFKKIYLDAFPESLNTWFSAGDSERRTCSAWRWCSRPARPAAATASRTGCPDWSRPPRDPCPTGRRRCTPAARVANKKPTQKNPKKPHKKTH